MALPSSPNPVSISQINAELGRSSSAMYSLGTDTEGRRLASVGQSGVSASPNQVINQGVFRSKARNVMTYTANVNTVNVYSNAIGNNYSAGNTWITVNINTNVRIGSANSAIPAISFNGFVDGDLLELDNSGYIQGAGGAGGKGNGGSGHNRSTIDPGSAGVAGGTGIYTRYPLNIDNASGYIWGGGGGGGGGQGGNTGGKSRDPIGGGGGGGGAGQIVGPGGLGGTNGVNRLGDNGSNGTTSTGGAGGVNTGSGGAGGSPGQAGASAFYAGGAGGRSIDGISYVNWISTGNTLGTAV